MTTKLWTCNSAQPKNDNLPVGSIKPVFHHEKGEKFNNSTIVPKHFIFVAISIHNTT